MNEAADGPAARAEQPPEQAPGYAGLPRDAQLEYQAILANASIGIAFTRERRFFLCNPRFAEMFGWRPEELIGQPGEVVYPSRESYEALGAIAVPVLAAGRQLDVEWEVRRRDGGTFLCRMIAKAIDPQRTQQGTVWIVEDITDRRRQADEHARLAREQEAILNAASIGICFVRDRRIVRCNRRFEEQHGYLPGELIGRPTAELYALEEAWHAVGEASGARLATGQAYSTVVLARRKDGSTYWSRLTGCAVDPGSPARGSVWLDEDITEQKRAQEELQRVLAEQQVLADNVLVGIAFVRDRVVVRSNRRFEEMFGRAPGEADGMPVRELYFTDEQYARGGENYAALDAGRTVSDEHWLRRRDGSGFRCRVSGCALVPGDAAKGYVWLFEDVTDRHRAEEERERLVREQELILDNATVGILFARNRVIQRVNRRLEEMTGYSGAELVGCSSAILFADRDDWQRAMDLVYGETPPGGIHETEWRFRRRDGSTFIGRTRGRRIDAGEAEKQWIWSMEDVTTEREAEASLRRALAQQELIVENAQVGIVFVKDGVIERCNRRAAEMHGYAPEEMANLPVEALQAERERGCGEPGAICATPPGGTYAAEVTLRRKDGSTFIGRAIGQRVDAGEAAQQWIWIVEDITVERERRQTLERMVAERTQELVSANRRLEAEIHDRKQAEARAQHLADHDPLTGLPNRRLLEDRLTQAIARGDRTQKPTATMFVDLDHFKAINDSLGHAAGDLLLREVAERLVRQLRQGDTVCRIGGDEFIVVLPEITRASDAAGVAQKILETVAQPYRIEDRELQISASIGISVFPDDGAQAETLIRNADAAMYHAKETGRGGYQFFTEQMNVATSRRVALETELRRALEDHALRVHYQPVADAASGAVVAYEALLRWQHPVRGLLGPAEFLQIAEDSGLILKIGEWALREACRWIAFVGPALAAPVSVNISPRQFADPHLPERVAQALRDSGVPPALLQLEVSEATAMHNPEAAQATLGKLKELGVSLTLDNFGAAFSNAARLRHFALDRLKVDRSLVAEFGTHEGSGPIMAAMVGLAHALGLQVVAEGVETEAQREFLKSCGCDCLQGFLIGRPAAPETSLAAPPPDAAPRSAAGEGARSAK